MKILVVEDDELTTEALVATLANQNYTVETAADGEAGWELTEAFVYDLILIDVSLPKLDGISLCQRLRSQGYQMPILLLTTRNSRHDQAVGLDAGADDYVVKPFDPEELTARIRALLQRNQVTMPSVLHWGNLQLDPGSCEVTYGEQPLSLTAKEYSLLELFLRNSHRVFSCGVILENLWSFAAIPSDEAVRTHIKGLRQKLKAVGAPTDLIETVYGIGYRLKPKEQGIRNKGTREQATHHPLQNSVSNISEPTQQQTLMLISKVWYRFKERVSEQVGVLEQAATALWQQELVQDLRQLAKQEAHTLAGSLGTFGLAEGSRLARRIESTLQAEQPLSQDEAARLREWVTALRQEIERVSQGKADSATGQDTAHSFTAAATEDDRPLLLIVERDRPLANKLVTEATTWGFRVKVAVNLTGARDKIFLESPNVVLLDPAISSMTAEGLSLLAELNKQVPPIPVIVFTEHDNLTERLNVARSGGHTFLQKSAPLSQVLEAVNQVLHQADRLKAKVMVVDDDPKLLAIVRSLLEPWGLKVTTLSNPKQFWEVLEANSPDLLILDIEMPQISGVELCHIVRNDAYWSGLPILFLTVHADSDTVNQVFSVGADDFVSKPIVGPELVTRIINRLERIRLLRNLAETDPLTKVSTRQKSTQDLDRFLRLAKRQNQLFCLAVLDLDHFKQVNDRHGHAMGDEVLCQTGQLLRRSFRNEDVVARWGGEEFVIGMYGINKQDGLQRLNKVLEILRQQSFTALNTTQTTAMPSSKVQITFSAGIAQYPDDGDDLHLLYQAADSALYQAKATGRDRIVSA